MRGKHTRAAAGAQKSRGKKKYTHDEGECDGVHKGSRAPYLHRLDGLVSVLHRADVLVDGLVRQQQLVEDLQRPGPVADRFQRHDPRMEQDDGGGWGGDTDGPVAQTCAQGNALPLLCHSLFF